ncbi:MAG: class I SAM-dependent methyltransferase [Gammaproteobacteria bacterium]|nr:class I SAM-dependent methyltransferase [Gammaproteobacteria bacterium]NND39953.1 class I SAM-dependent methyltransferase [Pseudomonadales bacterium]NNL12016.1 class I SAM-dependent methyltransferase [Pseudomonadales bacterium]NNM12478.1 class I SAM-dependent methyltransferase [Pseudomonadales bacterium]RZV53805.1 MAG: class I SAM-dependent methyltransferase [Pseudomonadales bacterium]
MSFYEERILPHVINFACGMKPIGQQREKVVPHARGRVLEIGMGSGLNLPYYNRDQVEFVWGLEPSQGMRRRAQKNIATSNMDVRWLDLPSETIPLDDNEADTIVLTYTLCTIPDWLTALGEMRRVLKPGGAMYFSEHGLAPEPSVQRWQKRLAPAWRKIGGGCNPDRNIPLLLEQGGFKLPSLEQSYIPGPKFASYHYWGKAKAG